MNLICKGCTAPFIADTSKRQFCGLDCYHEFQRAHPNAGTFPVGLEPWNKNLKGIHMSPATEFKKGVNSNPYVPIGTVRIRYRHNRKTGPRAWIKVADPNKWRERALVVWESKHGPIPRGLILHHQNRDSLDDELGNLALLSRAQHLDEHRHEFRKRARSVESAF